MKSNPKLTLVGAGPGDIELISVKGLKAIQTADVVLYDALVNIDLLDFAPVDSIKIFVGKRKGFKEYEQQEINQLIVDNALLHGHVVRLKGGDPFVFGRGQEEINFVRAFNIENSYIPGISSSIGVAGLAGIPVTHRGVTESFWVITGTTSSGKISNDIKVAAKTKATVVVLMGLNKLKEIAAIYKNEGKENLPVTVIQNGSLASEQQWLGTVDNIDEAVKTINTSIPGIIVLGEVVAQHPHFNYVELLSGKSKFLN